MKNLSKVLAVVLAFAMALSMVSFAGYTDVAAEDNCAEAVSVLSSLEILKGYEDGSFKPDATITRAEFATVVIRMLGLANSATSGSTIFTDVAADHWANGAIALAAQQGIVNGYGNGKFGPEDPVKYEEAIKMVVAALGYTPMADANGGYPGGYQVVAAQKGILDDISGAKVGQPATRGVVAMLAYNSLDVPLMEQTGFGTQTNFETVSSLLLDKLGVTKFEGVVTGTSLSGSAKDGKVDVKYNYQIVGVAKKANAQRYTVPTINMTVAVATPEIIATGEVEAAAKELIDVASILYVKDAGSDDATLVCILKDGNKQDVVSFATEDLKTTAATFTGASAAGTTADPYRVTSDADVEVWTDADAGEYEKYKLNINKIYVNGRTQTSNDTITGISVAQEIDTEAEMEIVLEHYLKNTNSVDVTLLSQVEDEYNVIYITSYVDGVVESISERNWRVYTDNGTYVLDETDTKNQSFAIYKDGELASFADIKENDVLSVAGYKDGSNVLKYGDVYITSEPVEGKVSGKISGTSKVFVDGEEYQATSTVATNAKIGNSYTFYVNARGVLVGFDKTESKANLKYGFASWIYEDANFGDAKVRLLTADGTWATVDLADKITSAKYDGSGSEKFDTASIDWDGTGASSIKGIEAGGALTGTTKYAVNKIVAYELNEAGEIKTFYAENYNDGSATSDTEFSAYGFIANGSAEYFDATGLLGGYSIDEDTVIFSYDDTIAAKISARADITSADEKKISVVAVSTLADREPYDIDYGYNMDKDTNVWPVLFGQNIEPGIDWTSDFFVVSADPMTTTNEDGDSGILLTGLQNGETVTLFLNSEDLVAADVQKVTYASDGDNGASDSMLDDEEIETYSNFTVGNIAKGDVLIYSLNAKGEAAEVMVLLDASSMIAGSAAAPYKALTKGESADAKSTLGYVTVGTTTKYHFVLGYVKDRNGSNLTLIGGDDSTETAYRFNADTIGANYNKFLGNGVVIDAVYGDAQHDPYFVAGNQNDGDFIFARVSNNVVVDDFVIISNDR